MKYLLAIMIGSFFCLSQLQAQVNFYYYNGQKEILEKNTEFAFIQLAGNVTAEQLAIVLEGQAEITRFEQDVSTQGLIPVEGGATNEKLYWAEINFTSNLSYEAYLDKLNELSQNEIIALVAPYFKYQDIEKVGLSNYLRIKLKNESDFAKLQSITEQMKIQIVGQHGLMPLWYTLSCTPGSDQNALEIANTLYESGTFEFSEPDLMYKIELHCVNDPFWGDQWALENTGQNGGTAGVDLNVCDAWTITTGDPNIVVAVNDEGIEANHPDLQANMFGTGYNTQTGAQPSVVFGSHGTACAGIIAAVDNNNQGVTGVAPDVGLMSIANNFNFNPNVGAQLADGIEWAWQNGADVISNSWGGGLPTAMMNNAIANALNNGRGGLGTIVVFSSGNNNNGNSNYPGNSNADIINVGAIDRCGVRSGRINVIPNSCDPWCTNCQPASAFGPTLDVVAGGTMIATADRQGANGYNSNGSGDFANLDYHNGFGGTSAAAPQVAAVAALILSVNPCLNHEEVEDIIERTAREVGPYTYGVNGGRPNGPWNNELGYGMVDAFDAVEIARTLFLQNEVETATVTHNSIEDIFAGRNVTNFIPAGDYVVAPGADVTLMAGQSIRLMDGFRAENGSVFRAHISPFNNNCNGWTNFVQPNSQEQIDMPEALLNEQATVPGEITGYRAYPNPFSEVTTFEFALKRESKVDLQIYDVTGKIMANVVNGILAQGTHQLEFAGQNLLPGIYYCLLRTDDETKTLKLILNRN